MNAKERARKKILQYLGDPENPYHKWVDISTKVCGYKSANQLTFNRSGVEEKDGP